MERAGSIRNRLKSQDANLVPKTEISLYPRFILSKIADAIPFKSHPVYPKTGISQIIYFSFRQEMNKAIKEYGSDPKVFSREVEGILDTEKYLPIVKKHFSYHLRGKEKSQRD